MRHLFILILTTLSLQSYAQVLPDYYVYLVMGDATLTKPGKKPVIIKQKQLIYKNDVVTLKKGTDVTLSDKDGNFWVLNTPGVFKVSEVNAKARFTKNEGTTGKYFKFLFDELVNPNSDFEMFVAGIRAGVSRGGDECNNKIFPLNGLKTSAASIIFKWHNTSPASDYSFVIYDDKAKELKTMNVRDTIQVVIVNEILQGKTGKYFWNVTSKDGRCEDEIPIWFDILTPEDEKQQLDQLIADSSNKNIEIQLQQIEKLEKNAFINAASERYAALIKANENDSALRRSYVSFLLKYGFEKEAIAAWK
ncbi:MAG: hypothetical protein ABI723_23665 [Bacteroidia bacterium]